MNNNNVDEIQKAILMASEGHKNDMWGDFPYLTHLSLVANRAAFYSYDSDIIESNKAIITAWLHDLVEDHSEYEEIIKQEFPEHYKSLMLLNRSKFDGTYNEYIDHIIFSGDVLALLIKISDMYVNLNNNPPERLRKRYENNFEKLMKAWINYHQS